MIRYVFLQISFFGLGKMLMACSLPRAPLLVPVLQPPKTSPSATAVSPLQPSSQGPTGTKTLAVTVTVTTAPTATTMTTALKAFTQPPSKQSTPSAGVALCLNPIRYVPRCVFFPQSRERPNMYIEDPQYQWGHRPRQGVPPSRTPTSNFLPRGPAPRFPPLRIP